MQKVSLRALVIMAPERREKLVRQLKSFGVDLILAGTRQEARRFFEQQPNVGLVLAETTLPDGDWKGVLEDVARSGLQAGVVVCARLDDFPLWLEALERGCQDVLAEPYAKDELHRLLNSAAGGPMVRLHRPVVLDRRRAAGGPH